VAPARQQEVTDGRDGQEQEQEGEGIEEHGDRSGRKTAGADMDRTVSSLANPANIAPFVVINTG
jgi:hypothetical protein